MSARFDEPVAPTVYPDVFESRLRLLESDVRFTDGQARPPHEVVDGRGTAAREVTSREPGQCVVPLQGRGWRHSFLQQAISELIAASRTAADDGIELCMHH